MQELFDIPGVALGLQLLGSLVAIVLLARLSKRLDLGGDPRIAGEDHARAIAEEAICGFDAQSVAIDRAGIGALLRDAHDRVLLIRQHGSHFAARQISSHAGVRLDGRFLTLATDDRRFGKVTLDLGDQAQVWAASLRRLGSAVR